MYKCYMPLFLSRGTLTRDTDIAILSVRHVPVLYGNGSM